MKTILKFFSIVFCSIVVSGCMHHSRSGVTSSLLDFLYPEGEVVDHSNDAVPHLKLPLRVGLAFVPEAHRVASQSLSALEKAALLESVADTFKQRKYIAHIEVIPELYLTQGKGFTTLSQIANLYNLDVVALVSYDHLEVREENILSLSYWTIVGAYIIPGETSDAQTFVDTAVFDVQTRKLLFRAPGIGRADTAHTMVGAEKTIAKTRNLSFERAVTHMTENLDLELASFREKVKNQNVATVSYRQGYNGGGGSGSFSLGGLILLFFLFRFACVDRRN